jgi:hypothetical protein
MGSRRTAAPVAVLSALALASSGVMSSNASAASLLSPFPIVQVTGKVAKRGTKLRRVTVIAPSGASVTVTCRGRGCPFRTKTYDGGTISIRKLQDRLLRSGVVVEISVTSSGAIGKYTRLEVRRGKPPRRSDSCLTPGSTAPVACPATAPGTTFDLSDGSVTSGKLADASVTATKIAADAVTSAAIAADAITASEIAADAVGSDEIAAGAVTTSEILDGTVTTTDISQSVWSDVHQAGTLLARPLPDPSNAGYLYFATDVNGGTLYRSDGSSWVKVAAGAAEASIPDGSITNTKLAPDAVTTDKIAADTITAADIATGAVDTAEILDGSVTSADIATDTIAAVDIATGAVTTAEILDSTVASADIAADTITAADIATDAVGSAEIAADAVTTGEILDGTVASIDIAADTITAADIATGAVTTTEILDSTVTGTDIASGTIQTSNLAAGAAGESTYRLVESRSGKLDRDATASTYILPAGGTTGNGFLMEDSTDLEREAGVFYLSSSDFALSGRTTKLRLRGVLLANGTAPGITVKVGLYPVTSNTGANDKNNVTLGTVVSGSEVTFSSISSDTHNVQTSADFTFPSTGFYVIGVNTSGTLANNSLVDITADLHVRDV